MKMKNTTKTNLLFLMLIAATIITQVVFSVIYVVVTEMVTNDVVLMLADELSLVIVQVVLMALALLYVCFMKPATINDMKFRMVGGRQVILLIIITILIIPISSVLNLISSIGVQSTGDVIADTFINMPFWKAFLYIAVIPGICEEVLFRGFIYHGFRRRSKFWAIIASSVMFGLLHMNFNQFAYATVMGIVLALVVEITGTLWSSIFIHLVFNGINVCLAYVPQLLEKYINTDAEIETAPLKPIVTVTQNIYSVITIVGMAIVAVCLMILVFILLAKVSDSTEKMKLLLSKEGRKTFNEEGKIVDVFFLLAVIPAAGFIIMLEVLNRIAMAMM